ncbi:MAG: FHA domain-containing protein [Planctomycetia bacterium]|nr:FHA domain-containing protein [Planctomycetia bacterium]
MLGTGWLTIRQAQEALKNGRLEEAQRLLGQSAVHGHKGSWDLLRQVAQGFVQRGERHLRQDDPEAAWNDLVLAEQTGPADDNETFHLRQTLTRRGLDEIKKLLDAADPSGALSAAELLRGRQVRHADLQRYETVARDWEQAREQADRGEFGVAVQAIERLRRLSPELTVLEQYESDLNRRREACSTLLVQLHEAVDQGQWRKVVEIADEVLAAAPQQPQARKARTQAWRVIEPSTIAVKKPQTPAADAPAKPVERLDRFLLWIDGVGGYLVCLGGRVTIGQATPEASVDVPFYADISRQHATLTRDGGSYLAEASRPMQVNGQPAETALLQAGDRITLGASCQLQFSQPVPVSATARLDLTSGHRLSLAVDAVLLMADTLLIGPGEQVHVQIPDLPHNLVLFRQKEGLGLRYPGNFQVDGQRCAERAQLGPRSKVTVEDFCFAIEASGAKLGAM